MISLDDQITCVRRELQLRRRVYPKLVAQGKMKEFTANLEIDRMAAVLSTLEDQK